MCGWGLLGSTHEVVLGAWGSVEHLCHAKLLIVRLVWIWPEGSDTPELSGKGQRYFWHCKLMSQ